MMKKLQDLNTYIISEIECKWIQGKKYHSILFYYQ